MHFHSYNLPLFCTSCLDLLCHTSFGTLRHHPPNSKFRSRQTLYSSLQTDMNLCRSNSPFRLYFSTVTWHIYNLFPHTTIFCCHCNLLSIRLQSFRLYILRLYETKGCACLRFCLSPSLHFHHQDFL